MSEIIEMKSSDQIRRETRRERSKIAGRALLTFLAWCLVVLAFAWMVTL